MFIYKNLHKVDFENFEEVFNLMLKHIRKAKQDKATKAKAAGLELELFMSANEVTGTAKDKRTKEVNILYDQKDFQPFIDDQKARKKLALEAQVKLLHDIEGKEVEVKMKTPDIRAKLDTLDAEKIKQYAEKKFFAKYQGKVIKEYKEDEFRDFLRSDEKLLTAKSRAIFNTKINQLALAVKIKHVIGESGGTDLNPKSLILTEQHMLSFATCSIAKPIDADYLPDTASTAIKKQFREVAAKPKTLKSPQKFGKPPVISPEGVELHVVGRSKRQ